MTVKQKTIICRDSKDHFVFFFKWLLRDMMVHNLEGEPIRMWNCNYAHIIGDLT
jgi:hypothetical protein